MVNARYLYEVAIDTGSTLRAAANVKRVFQQEMSQISAKAGSSAMQLGNVNVPGIFGAIGAAGVAGFTVSQITQRTRAMAVLANTINIAERSLANLAGGGAEAEQRIRAVQDASGGLVDRLSAMQIASKGATLGFADSSEELQRITQLAAKVSTVLGGDLAGNIDNMAAAAANLSFVRLDTLGISADETRKRFEELRKTMGDTEAFMLATLEVGERTYRNIDAQATGIQIYDAALKDLGQTLSTLTGGADEFYGVLGGSARNIDTAINILDLWWKANINAEDGLQKHKAAINQLALSMLTNDIENLTPKLQDLNLQIAESGGGFGGLAEQANTAADAVNNAAAAVKKFAYTDRAQLLANNPSLQALIESGAMGTSFMTSDRAKAQPNALGDSIERERKLQDAITRQIEQAQAEQSRLAKQTAADTSRSWSNAADAVEKAWKDAAGGVSGIPGVTGRSEVTQLDMDLAKYGLYQPKPDEYLRQVEDQLLNGVDRGISRGIIEQLTSQSTGFDLGKVGALPNDLLAQLFGQEYSSGRLFATPMGQEMAGTLFNTGAVGRGIDQQQAGQAGGDFIKKLLGENLPEQFASVAGEALKGLRDGIINSDDLGNIGQQAMDNLLSAFTSRTSTSPQVEAAANSLIAEFFRRYQEALNGGT